MPPTCWLRQLAVFQKHSGEWVPEVVCVFWHHPSTTQRITTPNCRPQGMQNKRSKSCSENRKNLPGIRSERIPGASGYGSGPFRNLPERRQRKKSISGLQKEPGELTLGPVLGQFWDPAGTQESTKNVPGAEKVHPETAPEVMFCVFLCRCCSESVSGPIFGGSDTWKLCSHYSGSTILAKSPF